MVTVDFFSESPKSACHKYRVEHPVAALNAQGEYHARYSDQWRADFQKDDVFYFQRNSTREAAKILYDLRHAGRPVVYDMDDDIFHIPETNPVFDLYMKMPHLPWHQVACMRFASVITVSCIGLVELYRVINPNVCILPNCIRVADWEDITPMLRPTEAVRIFWGGSNTHKDDLRVLQDVLPKVKQRFGDAVEIIIMGDENIFKCEVTEVPFGTYKFFQGVMLSCDIGLAPLHPSLFNLGKSDLRLKELSLAKLAPVASAVGEYNKPESGALLCADAKGWFDSIVALVENEGLRKETAGRAMKWVLSWDISKRVDLWTDLFGSLASEYKRRSVGKNPKVSVRKRPVQQARGDKVRVGIDPHSR